MVRPGIGQYYSASDDLPPIRLVMQKSLGTTTTLTEITTGALSGIRTAGDMPLTVWVIALDQQRACANMLHVVGSFISAALADLSTTAHYAASEDCGILSDALAERSVEWDPRFMMNLVYKAPSLLQAVLTAMTAGQLTVTVA
eukprot:Lankesteria_metandrocarpae@DN4223_c0_g1_i1.p2